MTYKNPNKKTIVKNLGLIEYQAAWNYQKNILAEMTAQKLTVLKKMKIGETFDKIDNHLIFCEHPHVYTLGRRGKTNHLLIKKVEMAKLNISYFETDRGGDITYHGPGQIVGYPILDLYNFFTDIHRYLRYLEESIILTLKDFGLKGKRLAGLTGVWVGDTTPRKICAMGVKASRWITMHGFAFNVNTNLDYFNYIVPCGITDKTVTSLKQELGKEINTEIANEKILDNMTTVFGFN